MLSQIGWRKMLVAAVLGGFIVGTVSFLVERTWGISLPPLWNGAISGLMFVVIWALLSNRHTSS